MSVAKIDESDEEEIEIEGGDEISLQVPDAVIGESELEKPADPSRSKIAVSARGIIDHGWSKAALLRRAVTRPLGPFS